MNKKSCFILIFLLSIQNIFSIGILNEHTGLGFGIGSGGYEVKGIYRFNDYFSSSLEYNNMGLENIVMTSGDEDQEIESSGTFKISSGKALLHFHPFASGFRVSAGYVYNLSDIYIEIEGEGISLDDENPDATSDISGTIVINTGSSLPYIGFGWGYSYEEFLSLDFTAGIQFIPKITGDSLIDYDISMEAEALSSFISEASTGLADPSSDFYIEDATARAEAEEALSSPAVQEAIASGDPFELYEALEEEGLLEQYGITQDDLSGSVAKSSDSSDNPFSSIPNPDDFMGDIQSEIDTLVEESGLGAVQDILGYAPLPVFSFGFSIFFY